MPELTANLTMLYNEVEFLDRFEAAAKSGVKGIEYLFPYPFGKEELAERLQQHGLTQVLHNLPAGTGRRRARHCLPAGSGRRISYSFADWYWFLHVLHRTIEHAERGERQMNGSLVHRLFRCDPKRLCRSGVRSVVGYAPKVVLSTDVPTTPNPFTKNGRTPFERLVRTGDWVDHL